MPTPATAGPRATRLSQWAKENAVQPPFTEPAVTVSTHWHDAVTDSIWKHHGTHASKHVTLRACTATARMHMVTQSVLTLCAEL